MKLYQIDNKLIVSEIEKPQCWDGDLIKYNEELSEWKKQAVEVAESEKEKVLEEAKSYAYWMYSESGSFEDSLQQGINLPENSVYTKGELVNENGRDTHKIFAYLNTQPKKEEKPNLTEISDDDCYKCQEILELNNVPDLKYTKRIIANIFTKGYVLMGARGLQIIEIYNYLKDKYELTPKSPH